jgi:GNAT superfamily N-acetyltransferase
MTFSDLALSQRLERAEGHACREFAEALRRHDPDSGATTMEWAGAHAVYAGVGSPITQSFGLGLFEALTPTALAHIEQFFLDRGAKVQHEVSPLAGLATIDLLCLRGYRPIEISSVMYRPVEAPAPSNHAIAVRVAGVEEAELWSDISVRGWAHDHPEFREFLEQIGALMAARPQNVCFLAESDGQAGSAGALFVHEGVALFAGASTVPEMRNRGLQSALMHARMRYAFDHGCDLAMMVAAAGSQSQRNAERAGFRIAYTRTKWELGGAAGA